MRIALFHDLPSGGAKRSLHETVRHLATRHRLDLYTLSTADERFCDLRPFTAAQYECPFTAAPRLPRPFARLTQLRRWRDLGRLRQIATGMAAAVDARAYDVLLAHPCMWTQAPLLLSHVATPAVYYCHEPPRALYERGINQRAVTARQRALDRVDPLLALYRHRARQLDRQAARAAQRVLVSSRFMRERVAGLYGVDPQVTPLGVDLERFRPEPDAARRREVLSVGAVQPSKGFDFLIASLACIPAAARPPLRLVGNSEQPGERGYLTQLAARCGVELRIEVGIDDAQLVRRYGEAALLAYAPHAEPFGLVALEAMACATPVLGVAEGGVLETIVDDVTGRLVPRDARQFGDAIRVLLDDAAARQRLGANARAHVSRHWSWQVAVAQLEDQLGAVAGGSAAKR